MIIQINRRNDGAVLYEGDHETILQAVLEAIKSSANLRSADLSSANLRSANLRFADLSSANLRSANLSFADLSSANLRSADLSSANLRSANLSFADLSSANLRFADLSSANLRSANLSFANLSSANLRSANLRSANLRSAVGLNPNLVTALRMLRDQPGKIRCYKLVTAEGVGPFNGGIKYEMGQSYEVKNADTNENEQCAAGISLATLDWCMKEWCDGRRILVAEFTAEDIAAIPTGTDGKFRVHRCKIVGEKDLVEIGLIQKAIQRQSSQDANTPSISPSPSQQEGGSAKSATKSKGPAAPNQR